MDGRRLDGFPADLDLLQRARPVYRDVPGFGEEIGEARAPGDLPAAARAYLDVLAEETGVPVEILSVGPKRSETVTLGAQ